MAWGMNNVVICLFGSSIMEGRIGVADPQDRWYNILHRLLSHGCPETCFAVINHAVGGESEREIMARFDRDILTFPPDFCLFMAEGNNHDCRIPERILKQGELQSLLQSFAARLPGKTRPVGVLLNPIVDEWHFATSDPAFAEHLASFGGSLDQSLNRGWELARDFYIRRQWPCLDLYALMRGDPARYVLRADGVHLNPAGHRLFAQKMCERVAGLLSEGRP